ncbi:glycosyltransferase [Nodularia sp. NIES-3585]|uniref:glycosyltransferase n=1 Tax=Nodularia sp. NIES-3585 TaxID=1973477 RepID=UPI000B5C850E|nr:glycosyltransferase [Nodularia sp. NIES-3585]GAX37968.1 family 2 glycosyl transferase [Nodularia sp. NIES-3585]
MKLRYVQVLDALDFGDAVSNQVIRLHQNLLTKGENSQIFSKYADYRVENYRQHIAQFYIDEQTIILHHFAGYSEIAEEICSLRGYKILVYHNITPHTFFEEGTQLYKFCNQGRYQLKQIIGNYNLILGDSIFNCLEAEQLGAKLVKELPIIVPDVSVIPLSEKLVENLRSKIDKVWLFVGRIAPNKRQDLLIEIFAQYMKLYPEKKHHLYLVGKYFDDDTYYNHICQKIYGLGIDKQVTLTGKVEDEELPAYYKAADIFICMSEHEGFCVPIVEAFNHQIPVVAYAETAVANTMGKSHGVLKSLDIETAVQKIHSVFTESWFKEELINHGLKQANRFTFEAVGKRFDEIIDKFIICKKQESPLRVSVVICTYNRSDYLKRCLNYLKDQDYPHFEVIVVNGPSTDDTMEILTTENNIKVVQNPLRNLSVSRNLGIQHASGEIVAFIDDDALPYDNWLVEIVNRYNELPCNIVGVGGRTFFANQFQFQFEFGIIDSFGNHLEIAYNDPRKNNSKYYRHLLGTNCSFRKDALLTINGFDEQYDYYLDETDLALRLQENLGLIVNANQAYVRHEFAQSHNRLGKYNFNWFVIGKNTAYFGLKNSKDFSIAQRVWITAKNILRDRCWSFFLAWHQSDLGFEEAFYYSYRTVLGALRGYYDSCFPRKLGQNLNSINKVFLPYLGKEDHIYAKETNSSVQKMHILIISQEFPPNSFGGIGAYNQTLARELIQMGHEVTVISRGLRDCTHVIGLFTHIEVASVGNYDDLPNYPILSKNLNWARKVAEIAKEVHRTRPISVIESALWDFEGLGILMLRPEFKVPLIVRLVTPLLVSIKMNGWQINDDFQLCAELEKELISCADIVIGISNSIKDTVVSTYNLIPDNRWLVQPLGVQPWPTYTNVTNYGELPKDLKRGSTQILFIGRLESRKGIDIFLQALTLIMPNNPDIFVWIAGNDIEGWTEKASKLFNRDVLSRVQFLGKVDEERRELLYANCDFLVFPSRYESFGLVPLEAMVYCKPVIGARSASIPEVIIDGECGLLFEPNNYQNLAEKILLLVNDQTLKNHLSQGAKKRVEVLSARNMAKASVNIYQSLMDDNADFKVLQHPIIQKILTEIADNEKQMLDIKDHALNNHEKINQKNILDLNNYNEPPNNSAWSVTTPRIIRWSWLNSILNNFLVPKMVKFINSVLFESMQRQTYINKILLNSHESNFKQQEIDILKTRMDTFSKSIEELKDSLNYQLNILHESMINEKQSLDNYFQEIKAISNNIQNLNIIENEMTRSEFNYQFKSQNVLTPVIINAEKIKEYQNNLRLNLGCGNKLMPNYINIDQRQLSGVDVIAEIINLPFEKGSVSEIYSAHIIEHFTEFEVVNHILPYWYQLIKSNGKLIVICPDAESMMIEYVKGNFPWENLRKVTYGGQDYQGNYHYNMYNPASLSQILSSCGFKDVTIVDKKRVNGLCYEMEVHALK